MENWKQSLQVPYDSLLKMLDCVDSPNREVEGGLQLLGIMIANGLFAFNEGNFILKER